MAKIEVEVRGKIEGGFDKLLSFFKKKAKFIEEKDRVTFTYFDHEEADDVRKVIDNPVDLRLRVTNKKAEIILKHGRFGGTDRRREFSIPIPLDKFDEAVEMFRLLGWDIGVVSSSKTFVFEYNGIEFALVNNKNLRYFEAEIMVDKESEVKEKEDYIQKVCTELKLSPFTDDEFYDAINGLNNVPGSKFDLAKQPFSEIKARFKEFF